MHIRTIITVDLSFLAILIALTHNSPLLLRKFCTHVSFFDLISVSAKKINALKEIDLISYAEIFALSGAVEELNSHAKSSSVYNSNY